MKLIGLIVTLGLLLASAQAQSKLSRQHTAALRQAEETFRTARLNNDEATIVSVFTADAALYHNGNKPAKGIAAIRQFWFSPSDTVTTLTKYETNLEEITGEKNLAVVGINEIA